MNIGITVKELAQLCLEQIKMGNGDKHVLISSDDEGNEYHTLFYGFTSDKETIEELSPYFHDRNDTKNAIILG